MVHIIQDIEPYPPADGSPGNDYMYCIGHAMNILAYHCPIFKDVYTFELLKASWSFWYNVRTKKIRQAYTRGRFFFNAAYLFNVHIETIPCRNADEFWSEPLLRIKDNRPLLIWATLAEHQQQDTSDDGRHTTFVGCGINREKGSVLLLSNRAGLGWAPVEDISIRLVHNRMQDLYIPEDCHLPSADVIKRLLKIKINNNYKNGLCYKIRRYLKKRVFELGRNISYDDRPPLGVVCGPEGIEAFATDLLSWKYDADKSHQKVRNIYENLLILKKERSIFFSILLKSTSKKNIKSLQEWQKKIDVSWKLIARRFATLMILNQRSHSHIFEIHSELCCLAEQERECLTFFRTLLDT